MKDLEAKIKKHLKERGWDHLRPSDIAKLRVTNRVKALLKKAQELITSCIMGLMLIIFSIFILRLIGVDILKIPGFE